MICRSRTDELEGGVFRLWLAASARWTLLVFAHGYQPPQLSKLEALRQETEQEACEIDAKNNPAKNPFACFGEAMSPDEVAWIRVNWYAKTILAPPAALFAFGLVGFWIAQGFRSNASTS